MDADRFPTLAVALGAVAAEIHVPWAHESGEDLGCVCECCPCNLHGCPVCTAARPDTGPLGYGVPVVHGVRDMPAIVTRGAARARNILHSGCPSFPEMKRSTHRRHRRAWRRWARLGDYDAEPVLRSLTGWEVA